MMSLEAAFVTFILMFVAQLPSLVTAIVAYIKSRTAIDKNTEMTRLGTEAAVVYAEAAATTAAKAVVAATDVKEVSQEIKSKLNGGIDIAVKEAVAPIKEKMEAIEKQLKDFVTNTELAKFADYVHKRNHDLLGAMQGFSLKMDAIMMKFGAVPFPAHQGKSNDTLKDVPR